MTPKQELDRKEEVERKGIMSSKTFKRGGLSGGVALLGAGST